MSAERLVHLVWIVKSIWEPSTVRNNTPPSLEPAGMKPVPGGKIVSPFHWTAFYPEEFVSVAVSCSPQSDSVRQSEQEWSRVSIHCVLREVREVKGFCLGPDSYLSTWSVCVCVCQVEIHAHDYLVQLCCSSMTITSIFKVHL